MALPLTNLDVTAIRDTIGESTNNLAQMLLSEKVNRWGINPPDQAQFMGYYGIPPYNLSPPYDIGMFRGYDHRYRAYTYDKVEQSSNYYSGYMGLKIFTKIINEAISDDAAVGDTVLRLTYEYLTPAGSWVTGGYLTGTVNKVGSVTLSKSYSDLGGYYANKVRMTLSSDTPLTNRYFDSRKIPTTVGEGLIRDDLYFEYIGNNQWLMDYNLFANVLNHAAPDGCTADGNGFYNLQSLNYAYWGAGGAGILVNGIKTLNESPYNLPLTFKLLVSSDPLFVTYDEYFATQNFTANRGWTYGGNTQTLGEMEFEGPTWPGSGTTTYCWLLMIATGDKEQFVNWEDTNIFNVKFKMT